MTHPFIHSQEGNFQNSHLSCLKGEKPKLNSLIPNSISEAFLPSTIFINHIKLENSTWPFWGGFEFWNLVSVVILTFQEGGRTSWFFAREGNLSIYPLCGLAFYVPLPGGASLDISRVCSAVDAPLFKLMLWYPLQSFKYQADIVLQTRPSGEKIKISWFKFQFTFCIFYFCMIFHHNSLYNKKLHNLILIFHEMFGLGMGSFFSTHSSITLTT